MTEAQEAYQKELEIAIYLDDLDAQAQAKGQLASIKIRRGDYSSALSYLQDSLDAFQQLKNWWQVSVQINRLAGLLQDQEHWEEAVKLYAGARKYGNYRGQPLLWILTLSNAQAHRARH